MQAYGPILRKYATATAAGTHLRLAIPKAGSPDMATDADWTPVAGNVRVSLDGLGSSNIATLPAFINGAWEVQLSAAELTCKTAVITISDSLSSEIDDTFASVETFGAAGAALRFDLNGNNDPTVPTQLIPVQSTNLPIVFFHGATGAGFITTLSKNGAAPVLADAASSVSEIGAGWYAFHPAATDTDTEGVLLLFATAGGYTAYATALVYSDTAEEIAAATNDALLDDFENIVDAAPAQLPPGSVLYELLLAKEEDATPLDGVSAWLANDIDGLEVVDAKVSVSSGIAKVAADPGDYYFFAQLAGRQSIQALHLRFNADGSVDDL